MSTQRAAQLIEAGIWLQTSGDAEGARRLFEQALKLDPANPRAQQLAGEVPELPLPPRSLGATLPFGQLEAAGIPTSAWDSTSNPGVHISTVSPGLGAAMDLVDSSPGPGAPTANLTREEVHTLLQGARDLLELDDHTGAMDLILKAEALAPNDPEVLSLRQRSEGTLQTMYESRLGRMVAYPRVVLKDDEIIWLNLDHRAGFVLAQIDGTVSFEDLFEVCGMSRLDTARILAQLVEEGVITAG
jgi:tetratricopeptide (TPR) repeat protein